MSRSYFRGYPIVWINNEWVYEDDHTPAPASGGKVRPCKKCGTLFTSGKEEVDPCLGTLPGVDKACCGHGIREASYIRFTNGTVIRGFVIEEKGNKR